MYYEWPRRRRLKSIVVLGGVIAVAFGLLFVGHGLGYIRWPSHSFMINDIDWSYYVCDEADGTSRRKFDASGHYLIDYDTSKSGPNGLVEV